VALVGAVATQLLATRYLPFADRLLWENWDDLVPLGAVGGALLGHLCWVAQKPSERVTQAMQLCVIANVLVWVAFLVFNPPLTESEVADINARRGDQDGLDIIDDAPIVVAGRWSGTWGAVNTADYALHAAAGPAVTFAELLVVPPLYIGSNATRGESYVIAGVGFVLSTSFWLAVGGAISAFRRAYHRRWPAR
jgi:hypothetical protein